MNKLKTELLAHDQRSRTRRGKVFFNALWCFLALTSAVFGYENLHQLFRPLIGLVPMGEGAIRVWSGILGAGAAVLLLDGGYKRWQYAREYLAESKEQIQWARAAEEVSFWVSVYFTTWVLFDLVLNQWLPAAIIDFAGQIGSVAFVTVAMISGVCMRQFLLSAPDTTERLQDADLNGQAVSERLAFARKVKEQGLLSAKQQSRHAQETFARLMKEKWEMEMVDGLLGEIEDDDRRLQIQGRYEVLQQERLGLPAPQKREKTGIEIDTKKESPEVAERTFEDWVMVEAEKQGVSQPELLRQMAQGLFGAEAEEGGAVEAISPAVQKTAVSDVIHEEAEPKPEPDQARPAIKPPRRRIGPSMPAATTASISITSPLSRLNGVESAGEEDIPFA